MVNFSLMKPEQRPTLILNFNERKTYNGSQVSAIVLL